MLENRLRKAWDSGDSVINGWLSIPNSLSAEVLAAQGYDSVCIDMQHGMIGFESMLTLLTALPAERVSTLVRVPSNEPAVIMKALDAGAIGVICPMVNTPAQAAALVSAMRYPPTGQRSFGPTRATHALGDDYATKADRQVLAIAMIETREAFDNVKEIANTPGLDALYIGPADLTLCLTGQTYRRGFDREEPEMIEAIQTIMRAAHEAGIKVGLHCGRPEYAARALNWGFDLVTLSSDLRLIASAASESTARLRELLDGPDAVFSEISSTNKGSY